MGHAGHVGTRAHAAVRRREQQSWGAGSGSNIQSPCAANRSPQARLAWQAQKLSMVSTAINLIL